MIFEVHSNEKIEAHDWETLKNTPVFLIKR